MAAAELSAATGPERPGLGLGPAVAACYLGLWALTLAGALATAVCAPGAARNLLGLRLDPAAAPSPDRVATLAAHNLPIAAWPLLLPSLGVQERAGWRALTDALVLACAAANTLPVAVALGGYQAALVAFVPQLPLEWGALAVGYGAWLAHRRRAPSTRRRVLLLGATASLSCAAAAVETYAVPNADAAQVNAHRLAGLVFTRRSREVPHPAAGPVICIN